MLSLLLRQPSQSLSTVDLILIFTLTARLLFVLLLIHIRFILDHLLIRHMLDLVIQTFRFFSFSLYSVLLIHFQLPIGSLP